MTDELDTIIRRWKMRKIDSVPALDAVLSDYRVLFAYHSNRIEDAGLNIYQTREVFENGRVMNYTGDLRTLFETSNQKDCYQFLREKIASREPITTKLILQIHEILTHGCYDESRWANGERPGTFRQHYYGVGMDAGADPEDVAEEIEALCRELDEAEDKTDKDENVWNIVAYFHLAFENIHPFADGNGRVGRTLLNYYLMIHDMPPVIIFDEERETYYLGLTVFDKSGKIDGFVQFLKESCLKTWMKKKPIAGHKQGMMFCL